MQRRLRFPLIVAVATMVNPPAVFPQEIVPHLGAAAGSTTYDLNESGSAAIVSARLDLVIKPWLVVQQSFSYFNYQPAAIRRAHLLFTDTQAQIQTRGAVQPFLGIGVGNALDTGRWPGQQFTLSASAGARLRVRRAWTGILEVRARSVDPFEFSTTDWLVGISKEIGARHDGN